MPLTMQEILGKLTNVRKQGREWLACCPAHEDNDPSLSIRQAEDGKILLHCFADCSFDAILAALKIPKDTELLRVEPLTHSKEEEKPLYPSLAAAISAYKKGQPSKRWLYHARDGEVIGAVCRWEGEEKPDGTRKKDIRPVAYDSRRDGWIHAQMPTPRPLWRLPALLAASPETVVYVCEGEKAAEAGQKVGLLTTTSAGGASAEKKTDWGALKGRRVVILPDNDKAGEAYAASVKRILAEIGAAESLVVKLPVTEKGDDLFDWLKAGGTVDTLERWVEAARSQQAAAAAKAEERVQTEEAKRLIREEKQKVREEKKKVREEKRAKALEAMRAATRVAPSEEWQKKNLSWRYDRDGEVIGLVSDIGSVFDIFVSAPEWQGVLAFDLIAQSPVFLKEPPCFDKYKFKGPFPRCLHDLDYTILRNYFSRAWRITLRKEEFFEAIEWASHEQEVHPVRDYLRSLRWDGVARVGSWLRTYLGGKASVSSSEAYVDWAGQMWMISAVARAFRPGCKADHVLVLEGREGLGKSSALRVLGGDFYSDTPLRIGEKDTLIGLQGTWIVELAEVEALLRAESAAAKTFFTNASDRYRPLYAKKAIDVPRSCVFAGTANHNDYIKDTSGGRRYWPVECTKNDLEGLARDRDQLWAEAVALYEQGAIWYPQGEELLALFKAEQEARQQDDVWENEILRILSSVEEEISIPEILASLGKETKDMLPRDRQAVGNVMSKSGWKRVRRRVDGQLRTTYIRPPSEPKSPPSPQGSPQGRPLLPSPPKPLTTSAEISAVQTSAATPRATSAGIPAVQTSAATPLTTSAEMPAVQDSAATPLTTSAGIPATQSSAVTPLTTSAEMPATQSSAATPQPLRSATPSKMAASLFGVTYTPPESRGRPIEDEDEDQCLFPFAQEERLREAEIKRALAFFDPS